MPDGQRAHGLVLLGGADAALLGRRWTSGAHGRRRPEQPVAVLGVVPSPFDDERSALVVHGDGPALLLAARAWKPGRAGRPARQPGRPAGALPAVTLADIDAPAPPPELAPVVGGRSFVAENSWALPAVVLLAGFLAALGILVWFRWAPRGPRERPPG